NAVSAYQGSTTTRQVGHPSGSRFPISRTAAAIFTAPAAADNVFESVNNLRNALRANDTDAVKLSFANVRTAAKYLNNQQAFYGGVQNQVNEATDFAAKQVTRLKTQISGVEDADLTAAILDMNQARQLQETALAAESRRPRSTLFDYLR
ncbi:MAG: hypothetical protein IT162_15985, partial [Bryobacterales bacterium]|nr:hypothetical protein [Bryobacterales bacterium]